MLMLFALVCMASVTLASVDRGFNGNIAWNNDLEGSIARAKTEKKPVMLLIHKTCVFLVVCCCCLRRWKAHRVVLKVVRGVQEAQGCVCRGQSCGGT